MLKTKLEKETLSSKKSIGFLAYFKQTLESDVFLAAFPALASGATQAVLFNPIDRALYIRVQHRRKRFFDKRNFERPFQSFMNAAVYRTLVGASYMFWQDTFTILVKRYLPNFLDASKSPQVNPLLVGLAAGSVSGFTLNTMQVVKFRMWSMDSGGSTFFATASRMYRQGGLPIFFRGCASTIMRDSVFGVVYEITRSLSIWGKLHEGCVRNFHSFHTLFDKSVKGDVPSHESNITVSSTSQTNTEKETLTVVYIEENKSKSRGAAFMSNLIAASLASIVSSPFNYVRSIVYGTPPGASPLSYATLHRSFLIQFMYIYRNGESYVEARSASKHQKRTPRSNGVLFTQSCSLESSPVQLSLRSSGFATLKRSISQLNKHNHPVAACQWASSRLNIGWGSMRVGLGMAISQAMFHLIQDCVLKVHRRER